MAIVNPNSKTNALRKFKTKIKNISKKDYILLLLGDVDCGYLIWYRAQKYDMSVASQLETSLTNYFKFISWLMERGWDHHIIVCSAPLPTIYDDQPLGEITHARRYVQTKIHDRTNLTLQYNDRLNRFCVENNLLFFNFATDT